MKKVLISVVAMLAFALTSNAQLWFGGSLGLGTDSNVTGNDKQFNASIYPKVGFNINDKFAVGAYLGVGFYKVTNDDDNDTYMKDFSWQVAPFARYAFAEIGDFSVMAEGVFGLGNTKHTTSVAGTSTTNTPDMNISFVVRPVLSYEVSEHFNLELGVEFLQIGFYHEGDEDNAFKLGAQSAGATLGFIYKL